MSWERPDFPQYAQWTNAVRVSLMKSKGITLRVSIGRNLWRDLGWTAGMHVEIEYGTKSDEGWIRLRRAEKGNKLMFHNAMVTEGALITSTARVVPGLRRELVPIVECKHIVTPGGDLLVKLPQQFWVSYERKKPYAPKIAEKQNGLAVDG
jgi:hypothetical protein